MEGDSASGYPRRQGLVISSLMDWEALQPQLEADLFSQPELPNLDFSQSILVIVFAGEKPSGGYTIQVKRIIQTDQEVVVYVTETKPARDQLAITQITYPYQIVILPRTTLPVHFKFEAQVAP